MKSLVRKLRGVIGTGLTWAVGWAAVSVGLSLLGGVPFRFLGQVAFSGLAQGFIGGSAFAVILSIAERRHTLKELSLGRVALWGGIGGMFLLFPATLYLLPTRIPSVSLLMPLFIDGLLGAGFAAGSVALARRADTDLLQGGDPLDQLWDGYRDE